LAGDKDFAAVLSVFGAQAAHGKDDKADQQHEAKPAAADGRPAKVKPAATEQQEKHNNNK
jgi:hypothetical protein